MAGNTVVLCLNKCVNTRYAFEKTPVQNLFTSDVTGVSLTGLNSKQDVKNWWNFCAVYVKHALHSVQPHIITRKAPPLLLK